MKPCHLSSARGPQLLSLGRGAIESLGDTALTEELKSVLTFAEKACRNMRRISATDWDDAVQEVLIAFWEFRLRHGACNSEKGFVVSALRFVRGKLCRQEMLRRHRERSLDAAKHLAKLEANVEATLASLLDSAPPAIRAHLSVLIRPSGSARVVSWAAYWKRSSRVQAWLRKVVL